MCVYICIYSHTYVSRSRSRPCQVACLSAPLPPLLSRVCLCLPVSACVMSVCLSFCLSFCVCVSVFTHTQTHTHTLSLPHTHTHSLTHSHPGDDDARAQHEHAPGGGGAFLLRPGLGDLRQVLIFVSVCICVMCVRMYSYDIWFLGFRVGMNVTEDDK